MQLVQKKHELVQNALFSPAHLDLIKDMYFKGSSDDEFQMFIHVCKKTGLDPAMKQIHPVKRWDSKLKKETMTVQTGIDGYRLIAERTGRYAPGREPTYQYNDGKLISATAYVKKQTVDGTWHEIAASAFFEEYVQRTKEGHPTNFWQKMAHNQLAKCAEALALRKAFPGDLSGIYTKEEMLQSETVDLPTPPVVKISEEEVEELKSIFEDCDPSYVDRVMNGLKLCTPPIYDLKDVPKHMYKLAKERAQANRDKYQMSLDIYEEELEATTV
jgi:phage recombination protein Bet